MSTKEIRLSLSFPLDSEGFLRRRCESCEREFKWLHSEEGGAPQPPGGYYCPYCAIQSHEWLTEAQGQLARESLEREAAGILQTELNQAMRNATRGSKFLSYKESPAPRRPEPHPLAEDDDMKRVTFACHPDEPVKVIELWDESVHCLICGKETT